VMFFQRFYLLNVNIPNEIMNFFQYVRDPSFILH
jgi:hypothetical protein